MGTTRPGLDRALWGPRYHTFLAPSHCENLTALRKGQHGTVQPLLHEWTLGLHTGMSYEWVPTCADIHTQLSKALLWLMYAINSYVEKNRHFVDYSFASVRVCVCVLIEWGSNANSKAEPSCRDLWLEWGLHDSWVEHFPILQGVMGSSHRLRSSCFAHTRLASVLQSNWETEEETDCTCRHIHRLFLRTLSIWWAPARLCVCVCVCGCVLLNQRWFWSAGW